MASTPPVDTELIHRLVPFAAFLGVTFSTLTPSRVVAHLPARVELGTIGAGVHGGAQMALGDITAAVMAVLAGGDPTAAPATVQSSTNFLEPANGDLTAIASVARRGRSAVIDVTIQDQHGTPTSLIRQVVMVRPQNPQR